MQSRRTCLTLLITVFCCSALQAAEPPSSVWPGFQTSPWFDEQTSWRVLCGGLCDLFCAGRSSPLTDSSQSPKMILHTRLVGEINGYLYAVTLGTPEGNQGRLSGLPRAIYHVGSTRALSAA